jgi:hypothetical protein
MVMVWAAVVEVFIRLNLQALDMKRKG